MKTQKYRPEHAASTHKRTCEHRHKLPLKTPKPVFYPYEPLKVSLSIFHSRVGKQNLRKHEECMISLPNSNRKSALRIKVLFF